MSITLTYSHNKSYLWYLTPQEYGHKNGTKTESDNHFKASSFDLVFTFLTKKFDKVNPKINHKSPLMW